MISNFSIFSATINNLSPDLVTSLFLKVIIHTLKTNTFTVTQDTFTLKMKQRLFKYCTCSFNI